MRGFATTNSPRACSSRPGRCSISKKEIEATKKLYGLDNPIDRAVWHPLPDGAPPGGGWCAIRAGLSARSALDSALGQPQQSDG